MERRGAQTNSQRYSAVALFKYLGGWVCGQGVCVHFEIKSTWQCRRSSSELYDSRVPDYVNVSESHARKSITASLRQRRIHRKLLALALALNKC